MRLAVLDVGSNTVHLLVVDAYRGAPPLPAASVKTALRLWEHHTAQGAISDEGTEALAAFVELALVEAEDFGCESVMAFATSAIREATNTDEVLDSVKDRTGVALEVLTGEDEARLTFLAVRRWFGWSSGRLAVFDIGGGSLEIATGADEAPDLAQTFALGAGRLTRDWLDGDAAAAPDDVRALRRHIRAQIARDAGPLLRGGVGDHTVATSKTFRSLARVCGAAPSAEGPRVRRLVSHDVLRKKLPKLAAMSAAELANLPGVSAARSHQLLAGALVADAVMDLFEVEALEICPWALREGVILQRLDAL